MDDFKTIKVTHTPTRKIKVENPTNYPMIGKGVQGAIFQISDDKCVKIYIDEELAKREAAVYKVGSGSPIMPKAFKIGRNYLIMQYIKGTPLDQYLSKTGFIEPGMIQKLIAMFKEMERLGFKRYNPAVRHIIVTKDNSLKIIDHVGSFKKGPQIPVKLLVWMCNSGQSDVLLEQLNAIDTSDYDEWKEYMKRYLSS